MAVDMFLKLDGIKGESTANKHEGEIDIMSFSWGVSQSGTMAFGGGAGAGKAQFQDLNFSSRVNKASPQLFLSCANGTHIKSAELTMRKAGGEQQEFLIIKLNDILVSSYQTGGASASEALPTDQFALNYAKIEFEYIPQKADGGLDAPSRAGWDLKLNKKI